MRKMKPTSAAHAVIKELQERVESLNDAYEAEWVRRHGLARELECLRRGLGLAGWSDEQIDQFVAAGDTATRLAGDPS